MIPDLTNATLASEMAAIGSDPAVPVDKPEHILHKAYYMETTTSSNLHRVPSRSRQWQQYLQDLRETKARRNMRIQREPENINDFLQRFPIYEGPQ